jgi:hypothetical protein
MRRRALMVAGLFASAACLKAGALGEGLIVPPAQDAGGPVSEDGHDAGGSDSGTPDAGPPDAGPPDAGPPDAGPDPHKVGGLGAGPWSTAPLTIYGSAQGLLEAPISASVDESENLWVVTERALYLLQPGARTFRRYSAQDGLHYGPGYTDPPDITWVEGGAKNECFVGYFFHDTHDKDNHTVNDPYAHRGKMDQVLLRSDGALEVRFYDLHNSPPTGFYYETREITSMLYDHFQHPGNLYIGSNHGVTRIVPAKWRLPQTPQEKAWPESVEREWFADHVHPMVCKGGPCSDPTRPVHMGDWYGLALAPNGWLWMGGLVSAGAIGYREPLQDWVRSWAPYNPFLAAFGDPYPGMPPVFMPPVEGDSVNIRAVAATSDGIIWFASGEVLSQQWRGPTYGLASWDGHRFMYIDPTHLGALEYNILELQALPDDRLVLGFPTTGLLVWKPGDARGRRLTVSDGLPSEDIRRMQQDLMHDPPLLLVPTAGGLAVFRQVP